MSDVLAQAADVIEPYVPGKHRPRERAEDAARNLQACRLLTDSEALAHKLSVHDRVVNLLACRYSPIVAERMAAGLAEAGLLAEVAS